MKRRFIPKKSMCHQSLEGLYNIHNVIINQSSMIISAMVVYIKSPIFVRAILVLAK